MDLLVVGKSTWVNNIATSDDLIVDIDKIWECISFCDKYNKPNKLQQNVFEIRNNLIEQIKMRLGNWQNSFVLGNYPMIQEIQRISEKRRRSRTSGSSSDRYDHPDLKTCRCNPTT